jgi:hypothetical protein
MGRKEPSFKAAAAIAEGYFFSEDDGRRMKYVRWARGDIGHTLKMEDSYHANLADRKTERQAGAAQAGR